MTIVRGCKQVPNNSLRRPVLALQRDGSTFRVAADEDGGREHSVKTEP